jgi:hypothetical protein
MIGFPVADVSHIILARPVSLTKEKRERKALNVAHTKNASLRMKTGWLQTMVLARPVSLAKEKRERNASLGTKTGWLRTSLVQMSLAASLAIGF